MNSLSNRFPAIGLIVCSLLLPIEADKGYVINQFPCRRQSSSLTWNECNNCFNFSSKSKERDALSSERLQIDNINFRRIGDFLTWTHSNATSTYLTDTTLTLSTWYSQSRRAVPLPTCCGISFESKGCEIDDCFEGPVYATIAQDDVSATTKLRFLNACNSSRVYARYFNLCSNRSTSWGSRYNCECVVYDTVTGWLVPGNITDDVGSDENSTEVWYMNSPSSDDFEVCLFTMDRANVMERGVLYNDDEVMDSVVFRRDVFYMNGYSGSSGYIVDQLVNRTVNCNLLNFRAPQLFNISSTAHNDSKTMNDDDVFFCLCMWPNGTQSRLTHGTHVKCMPQNATQTLIYMPVRMNDDLMIAVIVFVIIVFALALTLAIYSMKRKIRKFLKDTKVVPADVNAVMQESFDQLTPIKQHSEVEKECDAFDNEEKARITYVRAQKLCNGIADLEPSLHENVSCLHENVADETEPVERDFDEAVASFNSNQPAAGSGCQVTSSNQPAVDSGCQVTSSSNTDSTSASYREKLPSSMRYDEDDVFVHRVITTNHKAVASNNGDELQTTGVYWSKPAFEAVEERLSHASDESGCVIDGAINGCHDDLGASDPEKESIDEGKRMCCKKNSKDSGVVAEDCSVA